MMDSYNIPVNIYIKEDHYQLASKVPFIFVGELSDGRRYSSLYMSCDVISNNVAF